MRPTNNAQHDPMQGNQPHPERASGVVILLGRDGQLQRTHVHDLIGGSPSRTIDNPYIPFPAQWSSPAYYAPGAYGQHLTTLRQQGQEMNTIANPTYYSQIHGRHSISRSLLPRPRPIQSPAQHGESSVPPQQHSGRPYIRFLDEKDENGFWRKWSSNCDSNGDLYPDGAKFETMNLLPEYLPGQHQPPPRETSIPLDYPPLVAARAVADRPHGANGGSKQRVRKSRQREKPLLSDATSPNPNRNPMESDAESPYSHPEE